MEGVLANVTDHRLAPYGPQSEGGIGRILAHKRHKNRNDDYYIISSFCAFCGLN